MTLTTEELGDVAAVTATALDEVLSGDAFGKFAILTASEGVFLQAGNEWNPGEECRRFLEQHRSDPWVLEHREGGKLYRAAGHVTLDQVRQVFLRYLGGGDWRSEFVWQELRLVGNPFET